MNKKSFKIELISNIVIVLICISVFIFSLYAKDDVVSVSSYKDNVYYYGNRNTSYVTLMFNVYWGDEYIDGILDVLKSHDVKTTFFVGGSWADDNKEILLKFLADGHEIGNHGYFHKNQSKLSYEGNLQEIRSNNEIVKNLIGYEMRLFAPPSGDYSENTIKAAKSLDMQTIMWSIDTIDWKDKDENLIKTRALKANGGDLVLMHPTEKTLLALNDIIEEYKKRNLVVVPVSQNIANII